MARTKPRAIDLFSGCGGLSLGLKQAGFKVVAAIDADELAMSTYRMNHRGTKGICGDITKVKPRSLMKELGLKRGELDLLAGCPPCQGYSSLRTLNGARGTDAVQNDLVFQVPRFVKAFLPKAVMIENVPGLLKDARFKALKRELIALGYKLKAQVFDAADFGVPQRRRRTIIIASRFVDPEFAKPVAKRKTVKHAIGKLPAPSRSKDASHNYPVSRSEHVLSIIRRIPKNGGSRSSLGRKHQLACHRQSDGFKDVYGRMAWSEQSPTITSGCINPSKGRFIHPTKDRAITLREAALLQGFPRRYRFDMTRGRYPAALMIGNAFPPAFAAHHARGLIVKPSGNHRTGARKAR